MHTTATTDAAIWAAWNALPDDELRPVHTIAAQLALDTAYVASVVLPAADFGPWDDASEDFTQLDTLRREFAALADTLEDGELGLVRALVMVTNRCRALAAHFAMLEDQAQRLVQRPLPLFRCTYTDAPEQDADVAMWDDSRQSGDVAHYDDER